MADIIEKSMSIGHKRPRKTEEDLDYYREVGNRIKTARTHCKMSQQDLAEIFEVAKNTVYAWEKGRSFPRFQFDDLARVLHVNKEYLMCKTETPVFTETPSISQFKGKSLLFSSYELLSESILQPSDISFTPVPITSSNIKITRGKGFFPQKIEWDITGKYPVVEEPALENYSFFMKNKKLLAFKTNGNSMAPDINEQDYVIFVQTDQINNGDISLVYYERRIIIRRVLFDSEKTLHLEAVNNAEYKDLYVTLDENRENDFCILGRVIFIIPKAKRPKPKW